MLKKVLFPGKYLQGAGALAELPALVKRFGTRGVILASPTVYTTILPQSGLEWHAPALSAERFGGECCEAELARVAAIIREKHVEVVVGMGGGIRSTTSPSTGARVIDPSRNDSRYAAATGWQPASPRAPHDATSPVVTAMRARRRITAIFVLSHDLITTVETPEGTEGRIV